MSERLRILIADDSEDMRDLFKDEFSVAIELACQREVDWQECRTYREAAGQLTRHGDDFDIAVIDVLWPPGDALDAPRSEHVERGFTLMKAASNYRDLFVIGVSQGKQPPQDFVSPAKTSGAHAFRYWGDLSRKDGSAWTDLAAEACRWLEHHSDLDQARAVSGAAAHSAVPTVAASRVEVAYFLAIDTVSFSERADEDQLSIVRSLLSEVSREPHLSALPAGAVIPLFTGDGLIVAILTPEHRLLPLRSALWLQRKLGSVYAFELRLGIHFGSVNVVSMSDGSRQVLGHAINESVRVMSGAAANEILVSESYFVDVLHRGREPFPGYQFTAKVVTDKFGHGIPCKLVEVTA